MKGLLSVMILAGVKGEEMEFSIYEIMEIASGSDKYSVANATSGLFFHDAEDGNILDECLIPAPVEIFSKEDAATCVFDFEKNQSREFELLTEKMVQCPNKDNITLTVIPLLLEGRCMIIFEGLYFITKMKMNDGSRRLILCFSNYEISLLEGMNLLKFQEEVTQEYERMIKEYDETLEELETTIKEMEETDPFGYQPDIDLSGSEDNDHDHDQVEDNPGVRFVKEDDYEQ